MSCYKPYHWPSEVEFFVLNGPVYCGGENCNPIYSISEDGNLFTYYTSYVTTISQSCLYYLSQSNEIVFNTSMSYYYHNNSPLLFSSSGDLAFSNSGLDPVITPFVLEPGDKISFYNTTGLGWDELFEYTVKSGPRYIGENPPTSISGSVMAFELSSPMNLALLSSGSIAGVPVEPISGAPYRTCRYIIWKHVPDETNVMLRYNPKSPTIIEKGLLLPQYIDPVVRSNSGNVIKALKQQNLIVDNQLQTP